MATFSIIGLNYRSASVELRERFALPPDDKVKLLDTLTSMTEECVLLTTCNRTELIYSAAGSRAQAAVRDLFRGIGELSEAESADVLYTYHDGEALVHLYRVACALDSMVPGETQIIGQVKDAFDQSFRLGCVKSRFNRIHQHMLKTVKRVRNETRLGEGAVSVSSVAVQLAQHVFEDIHTKRVLLVGAGEMCALAGEHFQKVGVAAIDVANRSLERARTLAARMNGSGYSLSELPSLLVEHDIIFTSTASESCVLTEAMVSDAIRLRHGQPLFIIDISVPRDVEAQVEELPDVYLYNIDALEHLVASNLAARRREAERAEQIVREQADAYLRQESNNLGPLIQSLHDRVRSIKAEQLDKLYQHDESLTVEQRAAIDRSVDLILNKVLHDPLISLRRSIEEPERPPRNMVSLFKYFFNL